MESNNTQSEGQQSPFSSSISNSSGSESEQALLDECIMAGMPKSTIKNSLTNNKLVLLTEDNPRSEDLCKLTEAEQALLEQCILDGMLLRNKTNNLNNNKRITITTTNIMPPSSRNIINNQNNDGDDILSATSCDLTEAEQALLRQCILSGMPTKRKNNQVNGEASGSSSFVVGDLTEAEQALLEQCILAGMPQNNRPSSSSRVLPPLPPPVAALAPISSTSNSRKTTTKLPDDELQQQHHTCCIHCPKNNPTNNTNKQSISNNKISSRQQQGKKTSTTIRGYSSSTGTARSSQPQQLLHPERVLPQQQQIEIGRDSREINIFYVTRQILALKKEIVDRSHEEWV